jgi:hypothetical protein
MWHCGGLFEKIVWRGSLMTLNAFLGEKHLSAAVSHRECLMLSGRSL